MKGLSANPRFALLLTLPFHLTPPDSERNIGHFCLHLPLGHLQFRRSLVIAPGMSETSSVPGVHTIKSAVMESWSITTTHRYGILSPSPSFLYLLVPPRQPRWIIYCDCATRISRSLDGSVSQPSRTPPSSFPSPTLLTPYPPSSRLM